MKNSGIEWIGQIPDSWQYFRLKDYYVFEKGKNAALYTQEYIGTHNGEFPVYSGQTENDGIMGTISSFDYDEKECLFTTTVGAKVMTPKVLSGKFSLSQNCLIMKQVKPCCNKYIFYQLLPLFDYTKSMIPSYMQPSLRVADLNTYGFFVPNKAIQEQIANCLDVKCAKIDKLIEVQQAQIEKLKEYKQSVITEAVTKGLDPTAPMKDSGVEWIGKIPEGWNVNRIKYCSSYNDESIGETENVSRIIKYVDIGSVSLSDGITKIEEFTFGDAPSRARRITHKGDIIVSTVRTYLKAIAIIDKDDLIVSTGFCVLRPNGKISSKYMEYYCKSDRFTNNVSQNSYGISYPAINSSTLVSFYILEPSVDEQNRIADYLDNKCAKIDKLIELKQSKIEKLQEYKKSLIYEYVTGKKEVMGVE